MEDIDKEDYRKPSGDEGEVVFSQQEKGAATLGPCGLTVDRQNENEWLDDTEPYNGARPRMMQEWRPTMDVDQVVDSVLGPRGYHRPEHGISRYPGPDVASGTTNPTGGRNSNTTTMGTA